MRKWSRTMATTRLVVALALACAIDASVETDGSAAAVTSSQAADGVDGARGGAGRLIATCSGAKLPACRARLWGCPVRDSAAAAGR